MAAEPTKDHVKEEVTKEEVTKEEDVVQREQ